MGAGASSGIAAAIAASKDDDLSEVMKKLPAADREKVVKALAAGGSSAESAPKDSSADSAPKESSPETAESKALDAALTKMFKIYDLDDSGYVTVDESLAMDRVFCEVCGTDFNDEESRNTFLEGDSNKDGKVVLSEFLVYFKKTAKETGLDDQSILGMVQQTNEILEAQVASSANASAEFITLDDALTAMFQIYDIDKSGFVTIDESLVMDKAFSKCCGAEFNEEETRKTFSESDVNKDNKVSLKEFLDYFKKQLADAGLDEKAQLGMIKQTNEMLRAEKDKESK